MRISPRKKSASTIQSRMVPLIDVVFLLLIFFILTVNFSQQEGFLAAELPGTSSATVSEIEPLLIYVSTLENGDCQIAMGGEAVTIGNGDNFSAFTKMADSVMVARCRENADPVMLFDMPGTSWQHLLNTYDALQAGNYTNIIFGGN